MRGLQKFQPLMLCVFSIAIAACSQAPEPVSPPAQKAVISEISEQPIADPIASKLCPDPAPCGENCSNTPYVENDCWTTLHGPAAANVLISASGDPTESTNMLMCDSGPYALCFFSGPPDKTGTNSKNQALPCTLNAAGDSADCACQYYPSGVSYVDINAIINQNAFYETVRQCGRDGAGCANMAACTGPAMASTAICGKPEAKVCQYVRAQSAAGSTDPNTPDASLVPGYDTISTFSLAMASDYDMKQSTHCSGDYLGCMTAPCNFADSGSAPDKGSIVHCQCPIATGTYQIGQAGSNIDCSIPDGSDGTKYLWSAARTVTHGDPKSSSSY